MKSQFVITSTLAVVIAIQACAPSVEYDYPTAEEISSSAMTELNTYAQIVGGKALTCVGQDSDGDGYVSCTMRDEEKKLVPIECSYLEGRSGCKLSTPKTTINDY